MSQQHRDFCPRCAVKHLAQARALLKERFKGYPHHVWYAMGHMAEAEDEIIDHMPDEAKEIRLSRVKLEKSLAGNFTFTPDFFTLMMEVAQGGLLEEVQQEIE